MRDIQIDTTDCTVDCNCPIFSCNLECSLPRQNIPELSKREMRKSQRNLISARNIDSFTITKKGTFVNEEIVSFRISTMKVLSFQFLLFQRTVNLSHYFHFLQNVTILVNKLTNF